MSDEFDAKRYWIERHKKHAGEVASVGVIGAPKAAAKESTERFKRDVSCIASGLSSFLEDLSVLDVGCGYGRVTESFINAGYDYRGVDLSPDAIKEAQSHYPEASFVCSDIATYDPGRRFSLVFAGWVLIHIVDDQIWSQIVEKIASWTKMGGYFCLIEVTSQERMAKLPHVVNRRVKDYCDVLGPLGLELDLDSADELRQRMQSSAPSKNLHLFRMVRNGDLG